MSDFPPPQLPPPQPPTLPSPRSSGVPAADGTSWFRRRWLRLPVWSWLAIVAVVVVVAAAAVAGSSDDDSPSDATAPSSSPVDRTDDSAAPTNTAAEPDDSADATTEPVPDPAPTTSSRRTTTDPPTTDDEPTNTDRATTSPPTTSPARTTTVAPTPTTVASGGIAGSPDGASGTRAAPVPFGQVADIGEGWRLQVINVIPDAAAQVAAANTFNEPPPAGSTFTLVTVALGYFGTKDPALGFETTISALGADNVELSSDCGVVPDGLDQFGELFAGAVVVGNVCFVTTAADAGVLQLYGSGGLFTTTKNFLDAANVSTAPSVMAGLSGPQEGANATPRRRNPVPVNTPADLGDGWQATVIGPARDITDAVAAENTFNEAPPEGHRFVGVDVTYTYNGDSSASGYDVSLNAVGASNVSLDENCGVIPGELDLSADVFAGGSISGTLCFVVPVDDAGPLVLYGIAGFTTEDTAYLAVG